MPKVFPASYPDNARVMIFVDGENLSRGGNEGRRGGNEGRRGKCNLRRGMRYVVSYFKNVIPNWHSLWVLARKSLLCKYRQLTFLLH
jgi:hypothetical protein